MQSRSDFRPFWSTTLIVCTVALMAGCFGQGRDLTAVSGTVKANGKLVTEGQIMFYPAGGGRPAIGQIDSEGRYELSSYTKNDGVAAGKHKVTLSVYKTKRRNNLPAPNSVEEETEANMAEAKIIWLIPEKYSELFSSTLTAEVEKGKKNEINFDSADFE